jgi:hypothetical protein
VAALELSLNALGTCVRLMKGIGCRTEVLMDLVRLRGGGGLKLLGWAGFGGAVFLGGGSVDSTA